MSILHISTAIPEFKSPQSPQACSYYSHILVLTSGTMKVIQVNLNLSQYSNTVTS